MDPGNRSVYRKKQLEVYREWEFIWLMLPAVRAQAF